MKERIDQIIQEAQKFKISTKENLEDFRLKFLVKKGLVNKLFVDFKELSGEENQNDLIQICKWTSTRLFAS